MRGVFALILVALLVVALAIGGLDSNQGYVLVAFADTTVEMSLAIAMVIVFLSTFVIFLALLFLRALLSTRRGLMNWAVNLRRQRGLNKTTQGLIAFVEGRWEPARKSLSKAATSSSTPLVNYLFAARASAAIGDGKAVDDFLKHAELSTEGADIAIGLTQAELQINNQQYEQALATLLRVRKSSGHHPVVLSMLSSVYQALNDWPNLLKLLPHLKKANAVTDTEHDNVERRAVCSMLVEAADKEESADQLITCWKQLPNAIKKNVDVVACYAEQLISKDLLEESERLLRQELQRNYNQRLMAFYGFSGKKPFNKQQAFAEKLLKNHSSDPVLLLALGRIFSRDDNADNAIEYFQKSIALAESAAGYSELASICVARSDYKNSADYFARALLCVSEDEINVLETNVIRDAVGEDKKKLGQELLSHI